MNEKVKTLAAYIIVIGAVPALIAAFKALSSPAR